ncbi:hypothetical protein GCM10009730_61150 [Streptomyces albidochromogenes]
MALISLVGPGRQTPARVDHTGRPARGGQAQEGSLGAPFESPLGTLAEEVQAKAEADAWRRENGIFGFLRR